ncbi:MAG: hypothetical protein ACO3A4_06130 [Silvanigrellaceae bacterium]
MKFALFFMCFIFEMTGCRPRSFNSPEAADQSAISSLSSAVDFCSTKSASSPVWGADKVQNEIQRLIEEPGYKSSGLSAYAEVYRAMTAERDAARCSSVGPMVPDSPLARRLNDALADMMTKGFIESQRLCLATLQGGKAAVPDIGAQLCQQSGQALSERWSTLELSMASTAIYLSSLMGIALSALPHADVLWADTPYRTLEERIEAMTHFKPTYDAFNLFLSNNLHTVANVLLKNHRIDCGLFAVAAKAAEITKAPTIVFKEIRDRTFSLGLELSRSWPRGLHPITAGEKTWNVGRSFGVFAKTPNALIELYDHGKNSVTILKNPLMKVFKGRDAPSYVTFEGLTCNVPR